MKDHDHRPRQGFLLIPFLFVALLASQAVNSEVYKVVDEDGNVTYTDQAPDSNAKPETLRGLSIISPQKPLSTGTAAETKVVGAEGDPDDAVTNIRQLRKGYQDFSITSPTAEQIFWGTENTATIAWSTRYALQPGMKVVIYVDGEAREETANSMVNVGELWRGTHEVYAELVDARNRIIATTDKVSFHMKQFSTQFNARRNQGG